MKHAISAVFAALGLLTSIALAQAPGAHIGINAGYIDTNPGSGNGGVGLNIGYAFNEIVGLDAEYNYKLGTESGHLKSAFVTFTTTGKTYLKGKIGGTHATGDSFSGSSGSVGVGVGKQLADGWAFELDLTQYGQDVRGASLLIKHSF